MEPIRLNFCGKQNQRGDQRKKNGEDESQKINEINIELLIAESGRINVCGM